MSDSRLLLSLGGRCEVAWQLENLFGHKISGPFDWLVTPAQSIPGLIQERFSRIADPDALDISHYIHPVTGARLQTVLNRHYNVFLHHEFSRSPSGEISADWRNEIGKVSEKWQFVVGRWFETLRKASNVVFVRRRGNFTMPEEQDLPTTEADYRNLLDSLDSISIAPRLAVADPGCEIAHERVYTATVGAAGPTDWADPGEYWKGATAGWQAFLRSIPPI
ncbi:DUF1796 family putative cysteine peptidase [Achromobacter denitrificans]|uniref:DUF1796 family putative cysteine peptidase n=1 Tax=Achromobacter denitrificans TaxID=32002 RepID=UPI00240D5955|nr:DUF1796 family putative cysteine peptidase [Achromobacter denitrificans]